MRKLGALAAAAALLIAGCGRGGAPPDASAALPEPLDGFFFKGVNFTAEWPVMYHSPEAVDMLEKLPPGERMPVEQALAILADLCTALSYAHAYTIHRDIKPENVMLDGDGQVKLMDFGISKLKAEPGMTRASMVMGTPFYMAPEQLRGSREADARSDIYSVGVMLYEVLTGVMPTGVPKPVSEMLRDVPPLLDDLIVRCVDADPDKRYQSADELRQAIEEVRALVRANTAEPRAPGQQTARGPGALRRASGVLAAGVLLLAGLGGAFALEQWQPALAPAASG